MTVKDNEKVATIGIVERAADEEEITAPEQTDAEAQNEDVPTEE